MDNFYTYTPSSSELNTGMFEFDSVYSGNTTDVTQTSSGSGVHNYRDLTLNLRIQDRDGQEVTDARDFLKSAFLTEANISILEPDGTVAYANYQSGYKQSSFTFTEQNNIDIFGFYAPHFGIKTEIKDRDDNVTTSEFYFYGNRPRVSSVTVTDTATGHKFTSSYGSASTQALSGISGQLKVDFDFFNSPEYTNFDHVDIYWASTVGYFNDNPLSADHLAATKTLSQNKNQSVFLYEENIPQFTGSDLYLTIKPYSTIGLGDQWTVGPFKFQYAEKPNTNYLTEISSGDVTGALGFLPISGGLNLQDVTEVGAETTEDVTFKGGLTINNTDSSIVFYNPENSAENAKIVASHTSSESSLLFQADKFLFNVSGASDEVSIEGNTIGSYASAILLGTANTVHGDYDAIIAGTQNVISGDGTYSSDFDFIGAGSGNKITGSSYSSIVGGIGNYIYKGSSNSFIGGGTGNVLEASPNSVIGGGVNNYIDSAESVQIFGSYITGSTPLDGYIYLSDNQNRSKIPDASDTLFIDFEGGVDVKTGDLTVAQGITMGGNTVATQSWVSSQNYLTSETDDQTLDEVLSQGNTSASGITVGASTISGSLEVSNNDTGISDIFHVDGLNGRLFGVTDEVTGTVFSVNDAAGLPIVEVESTSTYDKITMGEYGSDLIVLSGQTSAQLTGSQIASQSWVGQQGFLTSETDDQTLDEVLSQGNTSNLGIDVGAITGSGNIFLQGDAQHVFFGGANTFVGESSNSQRLQLRGGGSTSSDTVIIDNDAKMGFGTTPSYGLHLKTNPDIFFEGNIAQNDYLFDGGGENLTVFRDPDNTNRTYLTFDKDDELYVGRQGSVDFIVNGTNQLNTLIQTDASENDVFFPDGKYGFGFEGVEPSALVHVSGDSFFDGNVGIGTINPSEELDVIGDVKANRYIIQDGASSISRNGSIARIYSNAGTDFSVWLGGFHEALSIRKSATDGLIGINDTTPSYQLDVNGTGHFVYDLYVDEDITMGGNIVLTGITSGDITGALGYTPLSSETDDQTLQEILDATPSATGTINVDVFSGVTGVLDVIQATGDLTLRPLGSDGNGGKLILDGDSFTSALKIENYGQIEWGASTYTFGLSSTYWQWKSWSKPIEIQGGAGTVMYIGTPAGDGNVGIGTSSPSSPLHIDGGTTSEVLKIEADNDPYLRFVENGANKGYIQYTSNSAYIQNNNAAGALYIRMGSTNTATFKGDGDFSVDTDTLYVDAANDRIGINNAAPAYDLDVNGTGHFAYDLYVDEDITMGGNIVLTGITSGDITGALGYTPLSSETDDQTLDEVLTQGNVSSQEMTVGKVEAEEFIGNLRGAVSFTANAGEALTKGDVVYISGVSGNKTVVAKADADDSNKMPAFGVANETVNINADVTIINFGAINNLDTDTPNWDEGDELYVSNTAGTLSKTAPSGEGSQIQKMAKVTKRHASTGSITIMGAGRTNAVPNLNEGRLFVGNSSNEAVADDTAYVDIANSRVGIGTTSPIEELHVAGNALITDGVMPTLGNYAFGFGRHSGGPSVYGGMYGNGLNRYLTLRGANGIKFFVNNHAGDSVFTIDGDPGNVGIGTTSPDSRLHVVGSADSDAASLGSEIVASQTASGTNWSGSSIATGYTHTAGSTDVLLSTLNATTNKLYRVEIETTNVTAGRLDKVSFGGIEQTVYISGNTTRVLSLKAISTGPLTFECQSAFVGTVTVSSVKEIVASDSLSVLTNSGGSGRLETRVFSSTDFFLGDSAGENRVSSGNNIGIGNFALQRIATEGINLAIGNRSLSNLVNGAYNVAIGHDILGNYQKSGNVYNIGIGNNVMDGSSITGNSNIMMGFWAGADMTSASGNLGIGYAVFGDLTSGSANLSLGNHSLTNATSGGSNVALGSRALNSLTTTSQNIAIGYQAGRYAIGNAANETPSSSIYIGYNTKAAANGETNQIVIGASAEGIGANTVTLGNDSVVTTALKGNVGIGTTSPDAPLSVKVGSSTTEAKVFELLANGGRALSILQPDNAQSADPWTFATNNSYTFRVDAIDALNIDYAGNVGIGITDPDTELEVGGTIKASTHSDAIVIGSPTTVKWKMGVYGANDLLIRDPNNNTKLSILADGSVGIGTTSPSEKLDIFGNILISDTANDKYFGSNVNLILNADADGNSGDAYRNIIFQNRGSETARIDSSGNVGIGTTSPSSRLSVQGEEQHTTSTISYADALLDIYNDWESNTNEKGAILTFSDNYYDGSNYHRTTRAAIKGGTDNVGNTADGFLGFYTDSGGANSANERMRIDHDGNVGIGTTSPTDKLTIQQTTDGSGVKILGFDDESGESLHLSIQSSGNSRLNATRSINIYSGDSYGGGIGSGSITGVTWDAFNQFKFTAESNARIPLSIEGAVSQVGDLFNITSNGGSAGDLLTVDSAGNVGIGTTNPIAPLDVDGNIYSNGALLVDRIFSRGGSTDLKLDARSGYGVNVRGSGNASIAYFDYDSGSVGIGTTSPSEKLDVQGNVKLTGNLNVGGYIHPNDENGNLRIFGGNDTTNDAQILLHGNADSWGSLEFNYGYDSTNSFLKISQGSNEHLRITNGGKVGIGTNSPDYELHVIGTASFTDTVAGAYFEENASNPELKELDTGTILTMDEEGEIVPSCKANDTMVFGASKRGYKQPIVMGAEPIKMTGPIKVGDFITTSSRYGHGMRSETKEVGTIIAQAMESGDGDSYNIKAMIRKM